MDSQNLDIVAINETRLDSSINNEIIGLKDYYIYIGKAETETGVGWLFMREAQFLVLPALVWLLMKLKLLA